MSRVFKNNQINLGMPFQINTPINFNNIKRVATYLFEQETEPVESADDLLQKAREEYDAIIREASIEALKIIEETEKELEGKKAQILEETMQRGYEEGLSTAQKHYEDLLLEAEIIRENAKVEYKTVLDNIEKDTVNVIINIAKKVIHEEILFNRENILLLVRQAFEKCSNKDNAVLKISSEDYDYICQNKEKLLSMIDSVGELEIKKDMSLKPGSCIVDTPFGSIDNSVQTKIDKIEQSFKSLIGN